MARERDDYDGDRRDGGSSGTKTVLIVLGVVGGIFLLGIVVCAGVIGFGFFTVTKQIGGIIGATSSAESFVGHLQQSRLDAAYNQTSKAYRVTTSRPQFDEFVKIHPLLTTHGFHNATTMNLPSGTNKTATISFTLQSNIGVAIVEDVNVDPDDPKVPPKMKPKSVEPPEVGKDVTPRPITCTLVLIEENGQWVVDKFTVP